MARLKSRLEKTDLNDRFQGVFGYSKEISSEERKVLFGIRDDSGRIGAGSERHQPHNAGGELWTQAFEHTD